MRWTRILAPAAGGPEDEATLAAAAALAAPFAAEVACAYAPADPADLMPWTGEGYYGGAQIAALDSLRTASAEGERLARQSCSALGCARASFVALESPVWSSLCAEARLSDVVVFGPDAARGRGPLAEAFQQVLMEERRPVLLARGRPIISDPVAIAWDGGREATRAARIAMPWLQKAAQAVILTAPQATPRRFDPQRLQALLAQHQIAADIEVLPQSGEPAPMLLAAVRAAGATLLVAGAFGHPRFQQFIFGGTTRALMHAEAGPSLLLSH